MRFRNLDKDGDWTFGKGLNNYASGDDAIGLNIRTRILSWLNDCFFAMNEGIDWVNRLGSKDQRVLLDQDLRRTIMQSDDVTELTSFDSVVNGRDFSAVYNIKTINSQSYKNTIESSV